MSTYARTDAYLVCFCAFYYSFIPLIYVLDWTDINKDIFFVGVLLMSLTVVASRTFLGHYTRVRAKLFVFCLSLPFSVYAFGSYVASTNHLSDTRNALVLTVINPIFAFLALFSSEAKDNVFRFLYCLALFYFVFVFALWSTGALILTPSGFFTVFGILEGGDYQNTNMYLGFLVLLAVGFYSRGGVFRGIATGLLIAMSLFFMTLIGGRASMASVVVVLCLWCLLALKTSWRSSKAVVAVSILVASVVVIVFIDTDVLKLFGGYEAVGVRRMTVLAEGDDPTERIFLFNKAIELFTLSAKNLIFGAGMNFFPVYTGSFSVGSYPHNIVLELLAEYGLVGFVLFAFPAATLFYFRQKELGTVIGHTGPERLAFMLFLYYFLVRSLTGGLRSSWLFVFILYLIFPAAAGGSLPKHSRSLPATRSPA